ncbi:MAG TPA: general secretion pathway protein GspB, partial [Steroidobacteraceae bacterium]|nr:general secretion pathway protein GspB [Steroidobacteraceae bacterium]
MSFILDALKKSELERQRQTNPGLMDSGPLARRPRFPLWAVALTALLVVNLGVLVGVLLRSPARTGLAPAPSALAGRSVGAPAASAPPAAQAAEAGSAPAAARSDHFSPMDAAPVYAPEVPFPDQRAEARGAARATRGPGEGHAATVAAPPRARAQDPVLTADADPTDAEVLPTISEINLSSQPALPELHLDVHVYATRPADRFVYINNRKYREGSALADGLTLEHIRRDG